MKKERNMFMIKPSKYLNNLKENCLGWIELTSGRIHNWAWNKRWKERDPQAWVKGYRAWKKTRCPHN
mgnify:CR=1 FL=1